MTMKRGTKETVGALALGGGLVTLIAIYESRRAQRASAPVVTHGRGRGRWSQPHVIGFDPLQEIADATDAFAEMVSDAVDASGITFANEGERSALIDRVMRAAFNQTQTDSRSR